MKTVEIEYPKSAIAILRLSRPKSLNALSWELVEELHEALDAIDRNNACRVVVLTGAGRGFCAGLDLRDQGNPGAIIEGLESGPRAGLLAQNRMASLIPHLRRIQQPIIAAINGPAYGGGLALALGCDVRIAARSARLCVQFIRVGVSGCDIGTSYLLPRLIGASRAHDLILTARTLEADEAERYGLVTRVVPDEEILPAALALAEELCDFTPFGLFATKQVMWANLDIPSLEAAIQLENRNQIMAGSSGETEEAARAFFEKRKPRWSEGR
ncbi:MAG: enoyl-CoA hydratase/isomerase family protein [Spirochaetaceae bacterium]|nr:enoyl-CoA hydratase/isomerase family protein [Spirochaetaceae bacterium]